MSLRLSTAPHIRSGETTRSLMGNVMIALMPCAIAGVYYFGANALITLLVSCASAIAAEALYQWIAKKPIRVDDLSALVTGMILGLNLPPTAPWWLAMVGSVFAVVIVKQLFGGIGCNFMNPALTARAVLLASWPARMTAFILPTYWKLDAVSTATTLASGSGDYFNMFIGNTAGCIGEVGELFVLVGLVYLLITKTISWRIPTVMIATTFVLTWIFGEDPVLNVLSGGLVFGAVFMATDYVTCPMTPKGQILYAFGCGLILSVIRAFSGAYPEGVTYSILLMNIATPLIDKYVRPRVYGFVKEGKTHA